MTRIEGKPPTIAVIIPARNADKTLARTLASLASQTRAPDQILLVDDKSSDLTVSVARNFKHMSSRLDIVPGPGIGPAHARNVALDRVICDYVAPLDADDLWHPTYIDRMLRAIDGGSNSVGMAYALHCVIDEADYVVRMFPAPACNGRVLRQHALFNFVGCGSAAVFRTDALRQVGGYPSAADFWGGAEDYLLQLRIAANWNVIFVPELLVGYRNLPNSLSKVNAVRSMAAQKRAVAQIGKETGRIPRRVVRWSNANAAFTCGMKLIAKRQICRGTVLAALGLLLDPRGCGSDVGRRLRNILVRPTAAGTMGPFESLARGQPPQANSAKLDGTTITRLSLLKDLDCAEHQAERP